MKGKLIWELSEGGEVIERKETEVTVITQGVLECINILFKPVE